MGGTGEHETILDGGGSAADEAGGGVQEQLRGERLAACGTEAVAQRTAREEVSAALEEQQHAPVRKRRLRAPELDITGGDTGATRRRPRFRGDERGASRRG